MEPPRLQSRRGEPGPVAADAGSSFWRGIEPITFRENVGGERAAQATRVRTAWGTTSWRVLFEVEDSRPWATMIEHDAHLWEEEVVEVFIDPVGDLESYFEVEINPLGAVLDVVLRRVASGWRRDFGWHVDGLGSHVTSTATGWTAELDIPFDALAVPVPSVGTCWRVNFYRIDRPAGPGGVPIYDAWSPTGMRNFHRPQSFGTVEFTEQ